MYYGRIGRNGATRECILLSAGAILRECAQASRMSVVLVDLFEQGIGRCWSSGMRKVWIVVLIAAAVIMAGCSAPQGASGIRRIFGGSGPVEPDYEVVVVKRGNIASTVSATGSVQPEREATLSFQSSGTLLRMFL